MSKKEMLHCEFLSEDEDEDIVMMVIMIFFLCVSVQQSQAGVVPGTNCARSLHGHQ